MYGKVVKIKIEILIPLSASEPAKSSLKSIEGIQHPETVNFYECSAEKKMKRKLPGVFHLRLLD